MRHVLRAGACASLLMLAGCGEAPDGGAPEPNEAGAVSGRIACALDGAKSFERNCTLSEMTSADGTILIVGREGIGYRRLRVTDDGRGVIAADGAVPAKVTIVRDGIIEVAIGADRYRLPASTRGAN